MTNKERAVAEMRRAECYRFLAACFYQPTQDTLGKAEFFPALVDDLKIVCPAAAPFAQQMHEAFSAQTEEELTVEYARLFVGPFALIAPPYGSVYIDGERTVMGPSTQATIDFYESEGLAKHAEFSELPDHIAVELEFMYYLVYRQVEALDKGDTGRYQEYRQKEEDFFGRFIGKWALEFCKAISEGTSNQFYGALASCVTTLLKKTDNDRSA